MATEPYKHNEKEDTPRVSELIVAYGVTPCQYTLEELNARLDLAMEQSHQGLGYTREEMIARKPIWR